MNQSTKKRLDQLEFAERSALRFPDVTPALMLSYATDEERAAWEAADRPVCTPAAWEATIDQVYGDSPAPQRPR